MKYSKYSEVNSKKYSKYSEANSKKYSEVNSKVNSGVTSVTLDTELLKSAAGLTLARTENTVAPANDKYAVGFGIKHNSDLIYNQKNGFTLVGGTIEHSGTITFTTDSIGLVIGSDFSVGYDASRKSDTASGFYVQDLAGAGNVLFDVGNPDSLSATSTTLSVGRADLLVSPEFDGFLNQNGLTKQSIKGADVGDVQIDAISAPIGVSEYNFMMPSIYPPSVEIFQPSYCHSY